MTDQHLDILAKILAKAERTNHVEERKMLFARAQTLSTRHGIDLAIARAHTAKAEKREEVEERTINTGQRGQVGLAQYVRLFLAICDANDIKCLISQDSTRVYAHGFPSDIEVAQMLYGAILPEMVAEADAYIASGKHKEEKVWVPGRFTKKNVVEGYWGKEWDDVWVEGHYKPVHGKAARLNFYAGFTAEIKRRLLAAKVEAEAAAVSDSEAEGEAFTAAANNGTLTATESANLPISTALVLQEKKAEVQAFYDAVVKRQNIRGSWKAGRRTSSQNSQAARSAGRAAGARTSLTSRKSIGA